MNNKTTPAAAWRGHAASGNILVFTEHWVETALIEMTVLNEMPRKAAENLSVVPLRRAEGLLPQTEKHNVLVIAANRLLRDLLCDRVAATPDFHLAGSECGTNPAALELMSTREDVVVLLWLPEHSVPKQTMDQIETIRAASLRVRLVLIGMPAIEDTFLAAVRAGVSGYVLNDAPMDDVLAAVRLVARGEAYCPSQLLPALFRCVAAKSENAPSPGASNRYHLSRRERQLVPLIAQGKTNKEIASELCLSEQTIKNHLRRMMRKAGAPNRYAVVERCQMASTAGN